MGSTTRRLGTAAIVAVVGALASLHAAPAGARVDAEPRGPVAVDDQVVITPLTYKQNVDVLANDSTPGDGWLQVCRVDAPDDAGVSTHIWSHNGWPGFFRIHSRSTYLTIEPEVKLKQGTYEIRYYACSRRLLTPATLTVEVRKITAQGIPDQPGVIRFTNPLDEPIEILYGPVHAENPGGVVRLGPHQSQDRPVRHDDISWAAFLPSDEDDDSWPVGYGTVHLSAPPAEPYAGHGGSTLDADRREGEPSSDSQAPVTAPDHVYLDYYDSKPVHVLANDSDADSPDDLAVCWVDVPTDVGIDALVEPWWAASDRARSDDPDRYLDVGASAATPGTYELTYYACDRRHLTPGTLTVTVRDFPAPKAWRVKGHPGGVRFHNGGYRQVNIGYSRTGDYRHSEHLKIPPHESRTIHVTYDSLSYSANSSIGPLGYGRVRDVQQDG